MRQGSNASIGFDQEFEEKMKFTDDNAAQVQLIRLSSFDDKSSGTEHHDNFEELMRTMKTLMFTTLATVTTGSYTAGTISSGKSF